MDSNKKRIAVIGAGPAGLAAAYQLAKDEKFDVTVYEMAPEVGGMCRSIRLWDCTVDMGLFFTLLISIVSIY